MSLLDVVVKINGRRNAGTSDEPSGKPVAALLSSDGYVLRDANGLYIKAKEVV